MATQLVRNMETELTRIIEHYGDPHQARKLVEEILELQEEIEKRDYSPLKYLYEEIADVYVVLHQFAARYDFPLLPDEWETTESMLSFDCSYMLEMAIRLNKHIYKGISKIDCIKLLVTEMHRLLEGIKTTLELDGKTITENMKKKIARTISRMEAEINE